MSNNCMTDMGSRWSNRVWHFYSLLTALAYSGEVFLYTPFSGFETATHPLLSVAWGESTLNSLRWCFVPYSEWGWSWPTFLSPSLLPCQRKPPLPAFSYSTPEQIATTTFHWAQLQPFTHYCRSSQSLVTITVSVLVYSFYNLGWASKFWTFPVFIYGVVIYWWSGVHSSLIESVQGVTETQLFNIRHFF